MIRLVATLLLAAGWATGLTSSLSARPAGPSPDPKDLAISPGEISRARVLIKKLGSEIYKEREEAQAELAKMGRLARSALAEAATSDADPEVRYRCARLLPKAGADELRARLDTFLADTTNKYEHDLPGLKQYRKHVGSDEKARALFVEMVKSPYNVELLQAIDKNTTEAGRAISDRRTQLYSQTQMRMIGGRQPVQPQQIGLADIAMLLFAETVTPAKDIPRTGLWSYVTGVTFLQLPASMSVLSGNANQAHSDVFKKIVSGWLESRDDVNDLNQLSYIAGQTLRSFPQAIPLLRKIVTHEGTYGYAKGQALMHLTQIKGKEELPFLKSFLKSDTQVQIVWFGQNNNQPIQHQCLLKDVALAYIVTLNGHNMLDFGFKFPPGVMMQPNQIGYGNFAFESDDARRRGMTKWGFMQFKYGPTGGKPKKDEPAKKDDKKKDNRPPPPAKR